MKFALREVGPEWTSKYRFENRAVVPGDPDEVFELLVDAELEKEWFPDYVGAEWLTSQGLGAVRDYHLTYMSIREHFTVWDPGQRLVFYLSSCTLPFTSCFMEDWQLEADGAGRTRVRWTVHFTPHWLVFPIQPLLIWYFTRDFRTAMRRFSDAVNRRFAQRERVA